MFANFVEKQRGNLFRSTVTHITPHRLHFVRKLGEGAFGEVYLGLCEGLCAQDKEQVTRVAIKMLKNGVAEEAERELGRETETLSTLKHDNIITFYGISIDGGKLMMVFEFMENGDLNKLLR